MLVSMPPTATIYNPNAIRTNPSPARHDEPTAAFYERCANPVIGQVRDNLEAWFAAYPAGRDRNDVRARLRSPDRRQWNGAFWELYVHEALRQAGLAPKPHPRLKHTTKRIDFVTTTGPKVYVECVTVAYSDPEAGRRGGIAALEAAIDRCEIYDYWLDLQFERQGQDPIPPDAFVAGLRAWLLAQDIDALDAVSHRGHLWLPSFDWDRDGWLARVWAIPRSEELRGRTDIRPLAIMAGWEDPRPHWETFLAQMELKAAIYGVLNAPYVIAVNAPDAWPVDRYGPWAAYGPHPFTDAWQRLGFFMREGGTNHRHVSAVLVGTAVQPHSFTRQWPTLYQNPDAEWPLPGGLPWDTIRPGDDGPVEQPGIGPFALFGLPATWPGDPWPD
jgi:hypothetical protein